MLKLSKSPSTKYYARHWSVLSSSDGNLVHVVFFSSVTQQFCLYCSIVHDTIYLGICFIVQSKRYLCCSFQGCLQSPFTLEFVSRYRACAKHTCLVLTDIFLQSFKGPERIGIGCSLVYLKIPVKWYTYAL